MFKKSKTVSLDVSLMSPSVGGGKRKFVKGNLFGNIAESSKKFGSQGRLRNISGTRSPMKLDLISGSNADLRVG